MERKQPNQQANPQGGEAASPASEPPLSNETVTAALDAALKHHHAGNLREAEAVYNKILELQPSNHEALHLLGFVMHQVGRKKDAADLIGKAVALKPDYAEALNNLGNVFVDQGEYEEAIAVYQKAIALNPTFAQTHSNLGTLLCGQEKFDEALAACQKAVALDPNLAGAHNNLGFVLQKQDKHAESAASFRKAIALEPTYAEAHNNLGNVLRNQRKDRAAVASYQRALALKPDYPDAHTNLGVAFKSLGRLDDGVAAHRKAIELKPRYVDAHVNLGIVLARQGKKEEALDSYRRALEISPNHLGAHFNHAMDHRFVPGDPLIETLKGLLEIEDITEKQRDTVLFALGKAHDQIGRYADAFSYHSRANEGTAKRVNFDPSRNEKEIMAIKDTFRGRQDPKGATSGEAAPVPIFVIGMSRSGKTLVEALLSQHVDAYGAGESHEWTNAVATVIERNAITDIFPDLMAFLSEDNLREVGNIYTENIRIDSPDCKLIIDTMPANYRFVGMILQALPTAKIIYTHRDPLDNCLFVYFYRYANGHFYSYDPRHLASFFTAHRDLMAHWRRLYGDRMLSVRYEDLVRNPADVGARIYEFCGLDYDPEKVSQTFTTDEIGHWKHYEPYLDTLRQVLGGLAT